MLPTTQNKLMVSLSYIKCIGLISYPIISIHTWKHEFWLEQLRYHSTCVRLAGRQWHVGTKQVPSAWVALHWFMHLDWPKPILLHDVIVINLLRDTALVVALTRCHLGSLVYKKHTALIIASTGSPLLVRWSVIQLPYRPGPIVTLV